MIESQVKMSMKSVSEATGLSEHTIRAWEKRYRVVEPVRAPGGRRLYSPENVGRLRTLRELVGFGHAIGTLAGLSDDELKNLLPTSDGRNLVNRMEYDSTTDESCQSRVISSFLDAIINYDLKKAEDLLGRALAFLGARGFVLCFVTGLFECVGVLVERKQLSIAQEHLLTSLVRDSLGHIFRDLRGKEFSKKTRVLLATPEDDLHEFGILMGGILCAMYGLETYFLGSNIPANELGVAVKTVGAEILVLGTSQTSKENVCVPPDVFVKRLDQAVPPQCRIWVGGEGPLKILLSGFKRKVRHISSMEEFDRLVSELP